MPRQTLPKGVGSGVFVVTVYILIKLPIYGKLLSENGESKSSQMMRNKKNLVEKAQCICEYMSILRLDLTPYRAV